jgi:hypothetical protein
MKKTVLTFGLIAGVMISVLMDGSLLLANKIGSGHNSMLLGYTMMVASFLLIYFGIRSYRDNTLAGQISFGRAFACGILIALITTVCYVATWEVLYFNFMPHFMDSYFAAQIHKVQSSGLDPATTAAQVAAIQRSQQLYQNPFVNMAYTFMEPLPVGLIITLISAAVLRRKAPVEPTAAPAVMTHKSKGRGVAPTFRLYKLSNDSHQEVAWLQSLALAVYSCERTIQKLCINGTSSISAW